LEHLPCIIISCLDVLSLDDYKQFFLAAEKNKIDLGTFIMFLFNGLKQALYRNDICFPEELITSYDILSTLFPVLSQYSKYFYYISSRYYLIQKGDIKISEHYCDIALSIKTEDKYLANIVEFQKAVILKHKTQLDDAINKFENLYIYFSSCQEWEGAAECVLEWGGALREKTMFVKALEIYEKIDMLKLKSLPALQSKLYRKRGTVHKNIMQQLLNEYKSNHKQEIYNKIYYCFNKALDEYDLAKKGMVKVVDTIEKMAIISEQAEICLKIANLEPKQMYRAEMFISEHENLLAIFPIHDSKIVYLRHKSKYEEMKGNISDAIDILENAREIAIIGSKLFRIFEVDYQLGRLIERYKETLAMKDLEKGMEALKRAINTNLGKDNQYIINCVKTKESLEKFISYLIQTINMESH
jgi:tetratricopeptide (TPR) repeat protein